MEVSGLYEKVIDPDIADRLGHLRSIITFTRISPLSEAETRWNYVLTPVRNSSSIGMRSNFSSISSYLLEPATIQK